MFSFPPPPFSFQAKEIIEDAQNFFNSEDWYRNRGIPYRRGYLFFGPPGCGKTSFCQVLAAQLKLHICVLTLSSKSLDDQSLNQRLHDAPGNAIILLEDVDAVFVERDVRAQQIGVTFSGLLNAIDGVASQEGRLFFMTTNHIEKLDPALIRPGRCDVKVKFNLATQEQLRLMFLRFFPDEPDAAVEFSQKLPTNKLSMAQVQVCLGCRRKQCRLHQNSNNRLLLSVNFSFWTSSSSSSSSSSFCLFFFYLLYQIKGYLLKNRDKPALALCHTNELIQELYKVC